METKKRRKNVAATTLSRMAHASMTPEQRKRRSQIANEAKRRKAVGTSMKPVWGLRPFENEAELIAYDDDKAQLLERAKQEERECYIEKLDYDPRGFDLFTTFASDAEAEVRAMKGVIELDNSRRSKRR